MGLYDAVQALHAELKRVDRAIIALEQQVGAKSGTQAPARRRGRKSMSEDERRIVAERMRRYWEAKRAQKKMQPLALVIFKS